MRFSFVWKSVKHIANQCSLAAAVVIAAIVLFSFYAQAEAKVSIRNGNFYIGYRDVTFGGDKDLVIDRVYNSKSAFYGIFGHGWGAGSEVALKPLPDGSVVVNEFGGGAQNIFTAEVQDVGKIDRIITLLKRHKRWEDKKMTEKDYLDRIRSDAEFRIDEVGSLYNQKLLKPTELPVGTVLKGLKYGSQYIVRIPAGYCRYYESGGKEYFDLNGRLTRTEDADGNWQSIIYGDQGRLTKISDNLGRSIMFSYNGQGLVEGLKDSRGREASYKYSSFNELTWSRDTEASEYCYEYDKRHNMTAMRDKDGTSVEIRYYPLTKNENVRSVKEKDGRLMEYEFDLHKPSNERQTISVTETFPDKTVKKKIYDYFYDHKATGEDIMRREVLTAEDDVVKYDYDDNGYILKMSTSAGETTYQYDDQHYITYRETPQEIDRFEYNPVNHKLTRFTESDKAGVVKRDMRYLFDSEWHLLSATDDAGNKLSLEYNGGDISKISYNSTSIGFTKKEDSILINVEYDGRSLSLEYNKGTEKLLLTSSVSVEDRKILKSRFDNIVTYYTLLEDKANVRIAGHGEKCKCTINQYEVPDRLSILSKFKSN